MAARRRDPNHRLPDGVGTNRVSTEGVQLPNILWYFVLSVQTLPPFAIFCHVLPHFAISCRIVSTFSRDNLLGGVAALLRRPRLYWPRLEAVKVWTLFRYFFHPPQRSLSRSLHTYLPTYLHTYTHTHIHIHIHTPLHVHVPIHMIYIYIHIHAYTHMQFTCASGREGGLRLYRGRDLQQCNKLLLLLLMIIILIIIRSSGAISTAFRQPVKM